MLDLRTDRKPVFGPYDEVERLRAALAAALASYLLASRRSGRSSRMLREITSDHRIVTISEKEGRRLQRELRERGGPAVGYVVCGVTVPLTEQRETIMTRGSAPTAFDHQWVSQRVEFLMAAMFERLEWDMDQINERPRPAPPAPELRDDAAAWDWKAWRQ
jgi:hypothetical protein